VRGALLKGAGDEGEECALPPFVWPPGPHLSDDGWPEPARSDDKQDLGCARLPSEMLGYEQPGDSHVHGVASRALTICQTRPS
jgi:hypothetical protein